MSVITLDQAKIYLRIDDDLDVDMEAELQLLINAAESVISEKTGHILNPMSRTYTPGPDGCVRVYEYPINEGIPEDVGVVHKANFSSFYSAEPVTLNVGYEQVADVPEALVNAALQLLKFYYYEAEAKATPQKMPPQIHQAIMTYKRFIL